MIMARRYRVRHGDVTYTSDPAGMGEVMTSPGVGRATSAAAEYGANQLRGNRGYEDVTTERFTYTIWGQSRACAAIYNATPGGVAADARYGLFSQVVSAIEAQYG